MPALATDHGCRSILPRIGSHPCSTTIAASHVTCCLTISSADHGSPLLSGTKLPASARLQRATNRLVQVLTRRTSSGERKKIERLFGEAKQILSMIRLRLRGLTGARDEFLLTATVQNLKRLANHTIGPPPQPLMA